MILDIWNWKAALTFSWGEMYGFFDWENFIMIVMINRVASSVIHLKYQPYLPGDTGFNLYLHAYGTYGSANRVNFHDDMFLYGIGYNFTGSGWWFKPFFAKTLYRPNPLYRR